jgi:LPS-assembly protein
VVLLPLVAAVVLAAAPAAAPEPPLEILESGEISYESGTGRWFLTGGAVLRRGAVTLRARSATYDPRTGEVSATGGVLLLESGRALAASSLHAVIDGPFEARDVVAFTKEGPLDLASCRTLEETQEKGHNRVTFGGARVEGRSGDPRLAISRPRVTLCDCGAGAPSWEIRASSASVVPGRHAWLAWPVFWITPRFLFIDRPVPVFAFPVAYLPLAQRQSGLLLPELNFADTGFAFSQPLYLALHESWDATIAYDHSFGAPVATLANIDDVSRRTVRGPGANLELRWAPSEGTAGRVRFFWLHDVARDQVEGTVSPEHGDRLALTLLHDQRLARRTDLRADVALVGDALYVQDFTADLISRSAEHRRSSAWLGHRLDDAVLAAEAGYHLALANLGQQLFPVFPVSPVDPVTGVARVQFARVPYGTFGTDLPILHRLPAVTATLLPLPVAGPLALSGSASLSRFAPLSGPTGDEGVDGVGPGGRGWLPAIADPGERDGRWQAGERLATTRAALRAVLRAPLDVAEVATFEPWLSGFAAAYSYDAGPGPQADARVSGGAALSTRLTRAFGRWRHDVEPRLEWRAGTGALGAELAAPSWDELDAGVTSPVGSTADVRRKTLTATPGAFQQASLALRNRISAGPATAFDLTIGQDVDLEGGRLAEAFATAAVAVGPLHASGEARVHPDGSPDPAVRAPRTSRLDVFSLLRANVALHDRRGDDVHASLIAVGPTGSESLAAGLDPILDPRPAPIVPVAYGSVGLRARLGPATLTYDAGFNARELVDPAGNPAPRCAGKSTAPHVYQHSGTLGWDSPCKCFKIALVASKTECDARPSVTFQFGLQELSGFRFGP